jgi:hypothetical protein
MKKISLVITVAIMLCANNFAAAQILNESFDGSTFPPTGWTNVRIAGAASPGTWQRVTTGTNPTCSPHSGAGMGYYNGYSWSSGNAGDLSTPVLDFSSGSFAVSFWMYRDSGQLAKYDSVSVYVDVNTSSAGGTRLGVINRSKNLAPAVSVEGWYQYTFNIPGSFNTATNYVNFKGTSDFGNRMYIDDISVYSLTPPNDLTGISASDSAVCNGSSTKLYASGIDGTVYWYTASCGGTLLGTGDSISVNPSQTTTYYARNFKNNTFSNNCSSISITVNSGYTIAVSDTICAHSNYTLADGTVVDTAGIYTVTVPTINGCDSTVTVTLALRPEITAGISQTICFGDSLLFNGNYYYQNGIYSDTLTAINGCDSIVTLTLTVNPEIASSFNQTICFGDSLLFNGNYYSQDSTYSDTLTAVSGCDSIVTLTLTILPQITTVIGVDICNGDSALFNGNYYSQNGNYKDTLVAVTGCDSIVTLNLFVRPQITSTLGQSICNGDSLLYNGSYYYQPGNYADTLTSVDGCDSIILLVLTVNIADTPVIAQNGLVLSTQSANAYEWLKDGVVMSGANSQTYTVTENGAYSVQTVDSNGCSSTSTEVNITGVGIAENNDKVITVFPNPATDFLILNNLPVNKKTEVQIFNATGQLILKEQVTHNLLRIDLLPSGVYTLLIISPDNYQRHIFVKK